MGRNTHSKRTKRNKRARAKLVEPWVIQEHKKLHDELMAHVKEQVAEPEQPEQPEQQDVKKKTKTKRVTVTMQ